MYKINCEDCDASYVDQTSRTLKTRIGEHKNHIDWRTQQRSVFTDCCLECGYEFDWNNIEILDEERILNKRLILQMIFVRKQKNSSNLQTQN